MFTSLAKKGNTMMYSGHICQYIQTVDHCGMLLFGGSCR